MRMSINDVRLRVGKLHKWLAMTNLPTAKKIKLWKDVLISIAHGSRDCRKLAEEAL